MIIEVHAGTDADSPHHGILRTGGRMLACALGRAGIRGGKREGDGATPAGRFALRQVLYRADRLAPPATTLPLRVLAPDDGWCDDDAHPQYNKPVRLPFPGRAEKLWREDRLYDLIVVIGYNDAPPIPGAGSAIFLHVAGPGLAATEGCVALPPDALGALVATLKPGDEIAIFEDGARQPCKP